jgi:hypothetical protein
LLSQFYDVEAVDSSGVLVAQAESKRLSVNPSSDASKQNQSNVPVTKAKTEDNMQPSHGRTLSSSTDNQNKRGSSSEYDKRPVDPIKPTIIIEEPETLEDAPAFASRITYDIIQDCIGDS